MAIAVKTNQTHDLSVYRHSRWEVADSGLGSLSCEDHTSQSFIYRLRPNSDPSQTSHCNIKGVSVSEVMRIENMITQIQFY